MSKSRFSISVIIAVLSIIQGVTINAQTLDLVNQAWIHGSANCANNTDPAIQTVQYNSNTWIFRQSKCTNYEAPFMFLFLGETKALLMDTGATKDEKTFPLYQKIKAVIETWESSHNTSLELIVAHTHAHGDHKAADGQFEGKPNTTLVGLDVASLQNFFGINNWPEDRSVIDLGNRKLDVIPIPGHQASSVALYDRSTKLLLTGDTFYPGRLYVKEWSKFKESIQRLVAFVEQNEVSFILGNHIEMTKEAGKDYQIGTTYQPDEQPLPLTVTDLHQLNIALEKAGDNPVRVVLDKFIIYPVN